MKKASRTGMVLAGLSTACAILLVVGLAEAQLRRRPAPGFGMPSTGLNQPGTSQQFSAIKLIEKSEFRQYVEVAQACIKDKAWNDAVTALQALLDDPKDFYVRVREKDPSGRESVRWTSAKTEANALLGSMPSEGLDVYEVRYGGKARQMFDEARRKGDWDQLGDVALRYLHTRAGTEATDYLATSLLDRGQFFSAALRFERLLKMNPERVKISDLAIFKTALAYRRAGEAKKSDEFWKKLEPRLQEQGGLKIGDQLVAMERLQQMLNETARPESANPHDWPLIRGNLTNSAQAKGSPPLLDMVLWQRPTLLDKNDISGTIEEKGAEAKIWVDRAVQQQQRTPNAPVLSGSFPLAVGRLLVYRSYTDVRAVFLQDEKDAQGKVLAKAGDIAWKSTEFEGSLGMVLGDGKLRGTIENQWLNNYQQPGVLNLVYENSLVGTLSSDHRLVYAVDDLAVPAPANIFQFMWNTPQMNNEIKTLISGNSLVAFELGTGRNIWRLGGRPFENDPKHDPNNDPFIDSHFLGPPLSVGGKLYVLNEKNMGPMGDSELRLVCIDPTKKDANHKPRVITTQSLGNVQQQHRITHDMSRRVHAVHLAYADGILVCPTNAGEVLGIDLLSRSLAWSYPYREAGSVPPPGPNPGPVPFPVPQPNPGFTTGNILGNWHSSPPAVVDGKVVFTAPDAGALHCINLHNGLLAWKSPRLEGDLFMAGVVNGKVLIVGKNGCRILNLNDGGQFRYIPTGDLPSGQGVACKGIYYLPLQKGEITAIDVSRGVIKAHNRATKATTPPGNLVFHEGMVVSQTPREILAYPQLAARLEMATEAVKADPNNPEKLLNRGEMRLFDGQVQDAVNDLRDVLAKNPPEAVSQRTRDRLFEAYGDLFHLDFNNASTKYLDEFRGLCKVNGNIPEEQQRTARFLRIVAEGREGQGNLVEAFQLYREFGDLPINREQGVAALDDPTHKVPTPVWLRGRISTMMARATPQQREPLEAKIAEEWKNVQGRNDVDAVRTFVGMFDVPFRVGREARLKLAESIMTRNDKAAYLEAELNLGQLRVGDYRNDPQVGGRALAALALLEEKKGHAEAMKLAAAYYREIGRRFPDAILRGDKTKGADLLNDLATDKRFLPYLGEPGSLWGRAKIAARELPAGQYAQGMQGFIFQPEGDLTPFMKNHRLVLDPTNNNDPKLRLVDLTTNAVRWTQNLGSVQSNFHYFRYLYNQAQMNQPFHPNARFRHFQVKGHLGVFQVGTMVYGLDLDTSRILWQHSLLNEKFTTMVQNVMPDNDGNLEMLVANQFGQLNRFRIGQVGAVEAFYVALVTQKGLVVLDPLRGTSLWSKMDVLPQTQVFGDDQHLFLVQENQGGGAGVGRVLRAIDGAPVEVPDFGQVYQNRVRILGRHILAAANGKDGVTLRLYDIPTGKDLWSKSFASQATVLQTDDPDLTGVIESSGKVIVLDAASGKELLTTSALQDTAKRIKAEDLKKLHEPLLLRDHERYYLALNNPVDSNQVAGGIIGNNFSNGLRCAVVNGWFLAFHAGDGQRQVGDRTVTWKKGDLAWHSFTPIRNQMVVLEQFRNLPVVLFSARFNQIQGAQGINGTRFVTHTMSIDKRNGKLVWPPASSDGLQPANTANPQYYAFTIDMTAGTMNMISFSGVLQHYIDDGRKVPPPDNRGVPGAGPVAPGQPGVGGVGGFGGGFGPPGIKVLPAPGGIRVMPAPNIRIQVRQLQAVPVQAIPELPVQPVPPVPAVPKW